jgi:hypothetical protein
VTPKFPQVQVEYSPNTTALLSRVLAAIKRSGASTAECDEFIDEVMAALGQSGNDDAAAVAAMERWVTIFRP